MILRMLKNFLGEVRFMNGIKVRVPGKSKIIIDRLRRCSKQSDLCCS